MKEILTNISGHDILIADISGGDITTADIASVDIASGDIADEKYHRKTNHRKINGKRYHGSWHSRSMDRNVRKPDTNIKEGIMAENQERSALTEAVYYILLSLHRPLHGYGIMQFVREISGERLVLGAGTLYGALNTLMEKGWIRAVENEWDSRKKEYEITDKGRGIVQDELVRLQELLDNGNRIVKGSES